jgi:hypothetical protein
MTIIVDYDTDRREARPDVAEQFSARPACLRAHRRDGPGDDLQPGPASGVARAEHHQAVPRAWPCQADLRAGVCCTASPGSGISWRAASAEITSGGSVCSRAGLRGPGSDRRNGQRGPAESRDDRDPRLERDPLRGRRGTLGPFGAICCASADPFRPARRAAAGTSAPPGRTAVTDARGRKPGRCVGGANT